MASKNRVTQPDPETPRAGAFWSTTPAEAESYKKRFSEQISRLQERQMELVKHTSEELESLKREFENGTELEQKIDEARSPLLAEIVSLREATDRLTAENADLRVQLHDSRKNYQAQYIQLQSVVSALKNTLRGQARTLDQQVRVFSLDMNQSLESLLSSLESAQLPAFEQPEPQPHHEQATKNVSLPHTVSLPAAHIPSKADRQAETFRAHEERLKKVTEDARKVHVHPAAKKTSPVRRFAVRSILTAVLAGVGLGGWTFFSKAAPTEDVVQGAETGSVAGASTDPSVIIQQPTDQYPESFAKVSYAESTWEKTEDVDMGISFSYPKNATNRVRQVSGDSMWILRRWGYLLKVDRDEATGTLDAWMEANRSQYSTDYAISKGLWKGQAAWIMTPNEKSDTSGTVYAVKRGQTVLQVWIKDADPTSDEGKWTADIVKSLQILPLL